MKLNKEMIMKIALIVFGMIAGIAGYEVVQSDDSVTVALPEEAAEVKAEGSADEAEAPAEATKPSAEEAGE